MLVALLGTALPLHAQDGDAEQVEVAFWISAYHATTYTGHILITNLGPDPIERWTMTFEIESEVTFMNHVLWSQEGSAVRVEATGWTYIIPPGKSVWFDLAVRYDTAIHEPANARFRDRAVTLRTDFDDDDFSDDLPDGELDDLPDGGFDDHFGEPGDVSVEFYYSAVWFNGFVGWFDVSNVGSTAIRGWHLSFDFPHPITIIWNGRLQRAGSRYTVLDEGWNRNILPGETISFGFQGTYSGILRDPSNCSFNGRSCSIRGGVGPQAHAISTEGRDGPGDSYTLSAFPNPGPTNVQFSTSDAQHVRLDLIDMAGQTVAVMFDGFVPSGALHSVPVSQGYRAAGVYVLRLTGSAGLRAQRPIVMLP